MTLPAPDFQTRIRCPLTASFSAAFASAFARSATSDSGAPSGTVSSNSTRNSMSSSLRRLDYEYHQSLPGWWDWMTSSGMRALPRVTEEGEQCGVDFVGMRPGDVVRTALDRDKRAIGNQRRKRRRGRLERKDAILGAVHDEHWDVDLRQISPEVGQPGIDTCVAREWR